jgi:hypothetical protein
MISFLRSDKPVLYIIVVLGAAIGALGFHMRIEGIFACAADGYGSDRYLAYCNARGYGEYDHGAFWFGVELEAQDYARRAEVLFLGNSRMQLGLSTAATHEWFSSRKIPYYLLGFSESEKYVFEQGILDKVKPAAKVYVVNLDKFFESAESESAQFVMHNSKASDSVQSKRALQSVHKPLCAAIPTLCGHQYAVFRSRTTGAWVNVGSMYSTKGAVSVDLSRDEARLAQETAIGRDFLQRLPAQRECVILTVVPTVNTRTAMARAIAAALGGDLVEPSVEGLRTFDGSHLDRESAQRWSKAFFETVGSRIEKCLSEEPSF